MHDCAMNYKFYKINGGCMLNTVLVITTVTIHTIIKKYNTQLQ